MPWYYCRKQRLKEIEDKRKKGVYPAGVWLGGKKYTLVREQVLECEGKEIKTIFGSRGKAGVCICVTPQSIVFGFSDENKGQKGGNMQDAVLKFAAYIWSTEE